MNVKEFFALLDQQSFPSLAKLHERVGQLYKENAAEFKDFPVSELLHVATSRKWIVPNENRPGFRISVR